MQDYKLTPFIISQSFINYKDNLNYQQIKVVEETDGPCLVLAGAGSGKTRVLIYRLAYLLGKGENLRNILLVTFTNRAAQEMINRAEILIKMNLKGLWAGTFHHIANVILHREAPLLGYSPNFSIIDNEDSKDLIDDCIGELGYSKSGKLFPKKDVISQIWSLATNSLREIDEIIFADYSHLEEFIPQIKRVIYHYNNKKKASNIMDFNDLLFNWHKLLKIDKVREKYAQIFKYILVDEYQDTNRLQFEILKDLAIYHRNILVVGDDAQSIYSFRSADINNILDFPKVFNGAKIFKLEINYRSSPQILSLANEVIKHNRAQFPKELKAIKKDFQLPVVVETKDVYQQARFVAQKVLELNSEGIPLREIAVLFRSHYQALELELELMKRNIIYVVRGGMRFFEQAHIKDVLAYLKVVANEKDELSFKRAISLHKGIGRSYAQKIWIEVCKGDKSLEEIAQTLPKNKKEGFNEFITIINNIKKISQAEVAIREILNNYKEYCYLSFDNPEDRLLDLEELAKIARNYSTIREFLLDISSYESFRGETILEEDAKKEVLTLSTIHQAKGLEWEVVFIIGFSDYEFPHSKALNSPQAMEEERRLFYVATTRAKNYLYITYPQTKYTFKNGLIISRPSMFLYELPSSCYEEWECSDSTNC
ncbi:MAG: ATP-dependent helicase [Candidatus Omnitrophica bacterium]|nr:ATP-dependent helicase [Candidatus Omnitrophota bacterium]MCM8825890.1 ATP-dependent helicase [Candidatus Omnitrophota bacterium]